MSKARERILLYRLHTVKDPEAFAELYDIYVPRIYRFVFFKVKGQQDAEDITAEVFLKAWHYVTEHREIRNLPALLYRIARTEIEDYYRIRRIMPEGSLEAAGITPDDASSAGGELPLFEEAIPAEPTSANDPARALLDKELSEEVFAALGDLKDEYREVLTMRYVDGLSITQIADVLDRSNVSVRVTQHRGLKALQKIMEDKS